MSNVMPGLVPGIHALARQTGVDGRDKPGHDGMVGVAERGVRASQPLPFGVSSSFC